MILREPLGDLLLNAWRQGYLQPQKRASCFKASPNVSFASYFTAAPQRVHVDFKPGVGVMLGNWKRRKGEVYPWAIPLKARF